MKHAMTRTALTLTLILFGLAIAAAPAAAQNGNPSVQHGPRFVDENGDGYNDNAPDHDGDGIPNGQDPDYVKPEDGSGSMRGRAAKNARGNFGGFVDEDGDGICDRFQDADGDGVPNGQDPDWVKPQDGTGNRFGMKRGNRFGNAIGQGLGSGICDGTGPRGLRSRMGSAGK